MNLTVKTLKGGKFTVEVEESNTVAQVKEVIERTNTDLPAASMKLIHSGKVLKDEDEIGGCNIKPSDFLVVMIAKTKKAPAAAAPAPAPAETATTAASSAPPAASTTTPATGTSQLSESAPAASTITAPAPSAATDNSANEFPTEVVDNLKALGFPESEVMACLRASRGNPDVAVEFLMNGIPPTAAATATGAANASATEGSSSSTSLDALRNHPQFNDLRRLVQTNPSTLQTVLAQIGQQQPELLRAINANQAEFLQMMNEPVTADSGATGAGSATGTNATTSTGTANPPNLNNPFAMDPAQLSNVISSMPPAEQAAMAQMTGMSVEQLQQMAQMISGLPQEQVQQYMNMAMAAQGMDMAGLGGGAGAGGGGGAQVLRLSEEEMAAVNRLTEMGFDRTEAAQAYLACDKNEALAANLLMDGGFGGFGGGGDGVEDEGDNDNDMYD